MHIQKLLQLLKSIFFTEKNSNKKKSPLQTLIILLILGVGLMLMSHFYGSKSASSTPKGTESKAVQTTADTADADIAAFKSNKQTKFSSFEDYASYYEDNLTDILNEVMGVSNVHVMVVVDSTVQNVYGKNTETQNNRTNEEDKDGGTRISNEQTKKEDVVIIDGGDNKEPLIITQKSPVIKGVWVVAYGVDNPTVKAWVIDAVSSVLGIPSYKVSVTQAKSKEE